MINAINQPTNVSDLAGVQNKIVDAEPVSAFYVKSTNRSDGTEKHESSFLNSNKSKLLFITSLLFIMVIGLIGGLILTNQQQDTRKQASQSSSNCSVCDLNSDDYVSVSEISQLSQCIDQKGKITSDFCFLNGQLRDPNGDGELNSTDTQICTECLGPVINKESKSEPTTPPSTACEAIKITNFTTKWINNFSQIELSWQLTGGTVNDYEIWNIGYGTLEDLGEEGYYLRNLTPQPLPSSTRVFVVTNPNDLKTRRFLIRGVLSRNSSGKPECFNQVALCRPSYINNRTVSTKDNINYTFTWQPVQKPHLRYEIWMIGNGTLEELGESDYYIVKLADITDINASSAQVRIPESYRPKNTNRFLIRAVNYLDKSGISPCHDQWTIEHGSIQSTNRCTLSFTISSLTATTTPSPTPLPTPTPTPNLTSTNTPAPTQTPAPIIGCNQRCTTNADCSNENHICFTDDGVNKCRLETNPNSANCQPLTTESLPDELPVAGVNVWLTWMKAGLAVLGIGAALLLML